MQKLVVRKIGPVSEAELDINSLTLLIGEQASGKSTLAKLTYFFKSIKTEWVRLANTNREEITHNDLVNAIRDQFYVYFGSTRRMPEGYRVQFQWDEEKSVTLSGAPLQVEIQPQHWFHELTDLARVYVRRIARYRKINDLDGEMRERVDFAGALSHAFGDRQTNLYIPAGRNITVAYSDEFLALFREELRLRIEPIEVGNKQRRRDAREGDLLITRDFIAHVERIRETFLDLGMDGTLRKFPAGLHNALQERIQKVLKGKYRYTENQGEYFHIPDRENVALKHASSGQQEAIRILQDALIAILQRNPVFRVIEEPEAHLFPSGQKALLEILTVLLTMDVHNSLLLTTHSPYILSIVNNLIYASTASDEAALAAGYPAGMRLNAQQVSAYMIDRNGVAQSIIDPLTGLIGANLMEDAWDEIDGDFQEMYAMSE